MATDIIAVSTVFLIGSLAALWLGCMWEHRDRKRGQDVSLAQLMGYVPPSPPERQLWNGETWEALESDPRDLWTDEDDARLRHPSSRRYGARPKF